MSLLARFQLEIDQGLPTSSLGGTSNEESTSQAESAASTTRRAEPTRATSLSPPTTPQAQRRNRSESLEAQEAQRVLKRKKLHALKVCRDHGLEDSALDNFAEQDTPEMLITIQATLLRRARDTQTDEASTFINSKEFKEIMKDRLRTCLLSPNLTGYLIDLPDNIFAYAKKNLSMFKIPASAIEDPEMSESIDILIKDVLTKQRAMIKNKIGKSLKQKSHISVLAKSLAPSRHYEITTHHWARFSFLRVSLKTFNELVAESMVAKVADLQKNKETTSTSHDIPGEGINSRSLGDSADDKLDDDGNHTQSANLDDGSEARNLNGDSKAKKPRTWVASDFWEYVDLLLSDLRD
ncbi:hypothetical protein PAXINDRAFT_141310, partial [Paxillus involutus ATCC 200175]